MEPMLTRLYWKNWFGTCVIGLPLLHVIKEVNPGTWRYFGSLEKREFNQINRYLSSWFDFKFLDSQEF